MTRGTWVVMAIAGAVMVAAAACAGEEVPIPPECNGAIELCERRFDQVSYPATHNAMASEAVNGTFLTERARQCQQAWGRLPNFVAVDFYSAGSLFETTRMLNNLP